MDLVSVGDLIIDFTCVGKNDAGILLFERNPGGAPINVASQLVKLGGSAGVICTVGKDEHGEYLRDLVRDMGIDITNLRFSNTMGTRCLFVYFKDGNDRYFTDYKSPRSDLEIYTNDLDFNQIKNSKVILYTSLSIIKDKPIYESTKLLLETARDNSVKIAYDPNFRFPYETSEQKQMVVSAIKGAHILKLTIEELDYFLGTTNVFKATEELLAGNAEIIAVTLGKKGCFLRNKNACVYQPAYDVNVLDTTGAGDSFMGALIYKLTRKNICASELSESALNHVAEFCNACASVSTTRRGSLLVMPTYEEVLLVMKKMSKMDIKTNIMDHINIRGD
ncbi:MAG: carbohydrate kinase [Prevotella sp.]|nr:carbohydrate kinase [Prevotella sp.]